VSVEGDGAGQDRDDGKGNGEIGEAAHVAEELLGVAVTVQVLHVAQDLSMFFGGDGAHGTRIIYKTPPALGRPT